MSVFDVTQELFEAVMGYNPSICVMSDDLYVNLLAKERQKYRPVDNVTWYKTIVFCNKLSILCNLTPCYSINNSTNPSDWGAVPTTQDATWDSVVCDLEANGYRLPTETEWEFTARGGDPTSKEWIYSYTGSQTKKSQIHLACTI